MGRILALLIAFALLVYGGWWWASVDRMRGDLAQEIGRAQSDMARCPMPLQWKVGSLHLAGFPWSRQVELRDVELEVIGDNGQSLRYGIDALRVTAMETPLPGSRPTQTLDGFRRGESARAWRLVAPRHFTAAESGGHAQYDVTLLGGGIAALALGQTAPEVTPEERPVRLRFPATLTMQVKSLDANGNATAAGSRDFEFPAFPSGWLIHRMCDTQPAQALFGLIRSVASPHALAAR